MSQRGQSIIHVAESLASDADADIYSRWIGGVIFATMVACCGMAHFVAAGGWPPLRWLFALWHVHSATTIVGVGIAILAMALFMHAHYFWTPHTRWNAIGHVGKAAAMVILVTLLLVAVIGGFVGWVEVPHLGVRRWL